MLTTAFLRIEKEIDYWLDLADKDLKPFNENGGKEKVKNLILNLHNQNMLRVFFLEKDNNPPPICPGGSDSASDTCSSKGLMLYVITDDFRGNDSVQEVFFYIKPEHRGNIRLFKSLVNHLEAEAILNNCKSVRIASNIGYRDEAVLKVLQKLGYNTDVVVKYMKG